MRSLRLNIHSEMPIVGLGTWQLKGKSCQNAVSYALEIGYRHIDTADVYENHNDIGIAINNSDVPRDKVFITTKVWRSDLRPNTAKESAYRFLEELDTSYIDLLLIHWPNKSIPISDTLSAFNELQHEGVIRAIGVSNFTISHLKEALNTGIEIVNNQVEFHPTLYQKELKEFCDENNIVLTAYSPIGQGRDLKLDIIKDLADKYNKLPSQIVLKWIISKNIAVIPRSGNHDHIKQNIELFDWEIAPEDLNEIDNLHKNNRLFSPHYNEFKF